MAIIKTNRQYYIDIANAIRAKGITGSFKPYEMAAAIMAIPTVYDSVSTYESPLANTISITEFVSGHSSD